MRLDTAAWVLAGAFALVGALSVFASIFNWDWFFTAENARMLTGRLSRTTARIIYLFIGLAILLMAWFVI